MVSSPDSRSRGVGFESNGIHLMTVRRFPAQSLSLSPFHHLNMIKITVTGITEITKITEITTEITEITMEITKITIKGWGGVMLGVVGLVCV